MTYVYLIGDSQKTKIGVSKMPQTRRDTLQRHEPNRLVIYALWECPDRNSAFRLERKLHQHFRRYRIHGEWFKLTPDWILHNLPSHTPALVWCESVVREIERSQRRQERYPLSFLPVWGVMVVLIESALWIVWHTVGTVSFAGVLAVFALAGIVLLLGAFWLFAGLNNKELPDRAGEEESIENLLEMYR